MANRRPNFRLPSVINPEGRRCIQIQVPDHPDHIEIFAGLTRQLLDWQRWERDPLKQGTLVAQVWREVWNNIDWTGEDCMGCCPEPTNRRYNSEGELEESFDGGITWVPAPTNDSRFSGTVAPPLAGSDGSEKRCIGATSVQEYVKVTFIDELATGAGYADLYAAAVAVVAALGVTGVGILIAAAVAAIFILGVSATQAAFTSEVWTEFKCILYCHIRPDASFTKAGWEGVKQDILASFGGIVSAVLYNWVNTIGVVGLTNSARSGFAAEGDCSMCGCSDACVSADFIQVGTLVDIGDGWIEIQADTAPYGSAPYMISYGSAAPYPNEDFCCQLCEIEIISGTQNGAAYRLCNGTPVLTQVPTEQLFAVMDWGFNEPTARMRFTFIGSEDCP